LDEIEQAYKEKTVKSTELYEQSVKTAVAGVHHNGMIANWPVERGIAPLFMNKGEGSRVWDVDGNEYADYWLGHSALFLGHAYPAVVKAVQEQAALSAFVGDHTEIQLKLQNKISKMMPCAEMVRFCNSGTEAGLYAVRVARGYTKRHKIGKFAGDYHGTFDQLYWYKSAPYDRPMSAGILEDTRKNTVRLQYDDIDWLEKAVKKNDLAAIFFTPAAGSEGGALAPNPEFLMALRDIATEHDILLIADEVVTGFRLARGGGQEYFGVPSDMAMLGKIMGGGIGAVGAVVGKRDIMEVMNPKVPERATWERVDTKGTFSGNALVSAAGFATLDIIDKAEGELNRHANRLGDKLREDLSDLFERRKIKAQAVGSGSLVSVHFTDRPLRYVSDLLYPGAKETTDRKALYEYSMWLITHGIYTNPRHNFHISTVHTDADIEKFVRITEEYLKKKGI